MNIKRMLTVENPLDQQSSSERKFKQTETKISTEMQVHTQKKKSELSRK